jgi:hypothetical protein
MAKKAIAKKQTVTPRGVVIDEDGFEVLGGGNGQAMEVGEIVEGPFGGIARTLPGKKKGQIVPIYQIGARQVLGGTVLKSRIEEGKVKVGDVLRITRLEDAPAKRGQNAAKLFDVRVKRAGK